MNIKELKKLITLLEDSSLESLAYEDENFSVSLKKPGVNMISTQPVLASSEVKEEKPLSNTIKAPLVGVFYSKPSPDKPSFMNVGTPFKKGDVLCIIEAMKVMNEIKATQDGVIKSVLVKDGDAVAFDTPLFEIQ